MTGGGSGDDNKGGSGDGKDGDDKEMNIMKIVKWLLAFLLLGIVTVLGLGMYKFNVLQDDIYMTGDAITEADMIGGWVKPVEGMPDQLEGFELHPGGVARSINMATLPYITWKQERDKLTLTGVSIGNGTSFPITDVFKIDSVGKDTMFVIDSGGRELAYRRRPLAKTLEK